MVYTVACAGKQGFLRKHCSITAATAPQRTAADTTPRSGVLPLQHVDHALESKPLRYRLPGPHQPPELRAAQLLGVQALLLGLGLLEVALLVGVDDVLELDQLQRQLRNTIRSAQNQG